jgi:hypothetical protein
MKKIKLTEDTLRRIVKRVLSESEMSGNSEKKEETKPRCLPENTMPLDEIVGKAGDYIKYSPGIKKRSGGVNSMVDTLGILNNIRWTNDINDGGTHLAFEMMNGLNKFRNKNYYDETSGECHKAMDKILELYKENEHGTELVKDIEKVLNLQTRDDEQTPSARAKEYLKQCVNIVKGN